MLRWSATTIRKVKSVFTVEGYVQRDLYTAVVGGPDDGAPTDDRVGIVTGSPAVRAILMLHQGKPVDVTPTGPTITLDVTDEASVYGALLGLTQVIATTGDVPLVLEPDQAGVDY
jgi:hypothetical protein